MLVFAKRYFNTLFKKYNCTRIQLYAVSNRPIVDTLALGLLTEAKIYSALTEFGYHVVFPARITRWDIGWEDGDKLIKVQCKTGSIRGGVIKFYTSSRGSKNTGRQHYRNQVHYFAVYVQALDKVYLIPVEDVGRTQAALRIDATRNDQARKIRWAKDYELKKSLSKQK